MRWCDRIGWGVGVALAGCYAPDLAPCAVHCDDTVPCPDDMTCGGDKHCHHAADTTTCPNDVLVSVKKTGDGGGRVTSPSGIDCGTTCSVTVAPGTNVALLATANPGSRFARWTGACSGTDTCTIAATADQTATATFDLAGELELVFVGSGGGTVTSSPAGIACTAACHAAFDVGTVVTLTAIPDEFSSFQGWGAPCTSDPCTLTIEATSTVSVDFE